MIHSRFIALFALSFLIVPADAGTTAAFLRCMRLHLIGPLVQRIPDVRLSLSSIYKLKKTVRANGILSAFQMIADENGPVVRVKFPNRSMLMVGDPKVSSEILAGTDNKDPSFQKWQSPVAENLGHMLGPESIFALNGTEWEVQSKQLRGAFTPNAMENSGVFNSIVDVNERRIAQLKANGLPFDQVEESKKTSFEVMLKGLFGMELSPQKTDAVLADFYRAYGSILEQASPDALTMLARMGGGSWKNTDFGKRLDAFVDEVIAQGRAQKNEQQSSFMSALLKMKDGEGHPISKSQLHQHVMFFLVAGHDTTASLGAWTWNQILSHPAVKAKVFSEITQLDTRLLTSAKLAQALPYTYLVIQETARLHPPVYAFQRQALKDVTTETSDGKQVDIKKGQVVAICPFLSQRNSAVWGKDKTGYDADEFVPERWSKANFQATQMSGSTHKDMAFGQGPRVCLGKSMAIQEVLVNIALQMKGMPSISLISKMPAPKTTADLSYRINEPMMVGAGPR